MAIPLWIESFYFVSQVIFFYRMYIQTKDSRKANVSYNSKTYWMITILGTLFVIVYAFLIGSFVMVGINILTVLYSFYHSRIGESNVDSIKRGEYYPPL